MSDVLIEAIGVTKHYGKFAALGGVDLKIRRNTVHSVIGPNGAGKTTLFHMLTGTGTTTGGRIVFDGHDVTREPDHKRVQRGMARSFQVTSLFASLSVRENLRVAAQGIAPRQAMNCWRAPVGERACADTVAEVLSRVGLERLADTPASVLSHGQQRRLEVGMALAAKAQGHLSRRADLGHGHRRPGRHEAAHSRPARRAHRGADRAQHEHRDGHLGHRDRDATGPRAGRRAAGRHPLGCARAHGVPGQHDHRGQGMTRRFFLPLPLGRGRNSQALAGHQKTKAAR
jgi:ABC-type branched-subunit amino acid transport system ATPase component